MTEAVCGYYGKLPVSPEFLRFHAAGPEVRELDEWLERGIQYAKARAGAEWPALVAQADIWNFLFVPETNGRVVCGLVFASRDRAGRSFPFLTFLLLECRPVPPAPWLIPLKCRVFLEKARRLIQQLRADLDWNTFRASAESLSPEVDSDAVIEAGFQEYLAHTTIEEFRSRLGGASDHPQQEGRGPTTAFYRPSGSEPFGKQAGSGRYLPLLREQPVETYDVPFWLEFHARWSGVKTGPVSSSITFWNRAPSKVEPCVLLSIGRPSSNLARFIVSPNETDEAWDAGVVCIENSPEGISSSSVSPMRAMEDRNISLKQYLDLLN
ncbi:MAG TPA: type VI secretion system-associated protein TagF [Nitrospira sp.]|nr:type VI secretion system-associated protein TagF [Nitrospira sp.]